MTQYHIVWNANRSEGFITDDYDDAIQAAYGRQHGHSSSTLGMEFRECYDDGPIHLQTVEIHPPLSKRAEKLLERIRQGYFYRAYANDTPKAMQELLDHGLIRIGGRVQTTVAAYVALNHRPFVMDEAPGAPDV
jgi:hypothetical protein